MYIILYICYCPHQDLHLPRNLWGFPTLDSLAQVQITLAPESLLGQRSHWATGTFHWDTGTSKRIWWWNGGHDQTGDMRIVLMEIYQPDKYMHKHQTLIQWPDLWGWWIIRTQILWKSRGTPYLPKRSLTKGLPPMNLYERYERFTRNYLHIPVAVGILWGEVTLDFHSRELHMACVDWGSHGSQIDPTLDIGRFRGFSVMFVAFVRSLFSDNMLAGRGG